MPLDIEALYRRYGPMVIRRCRQLLKDDDRALDAAQDVFVRLAQRQDSLEVTAPGGLLLRMATNVCLNLLRADRARPETHDDEILHEIARSPDTGDSVLARLRLDRIFGREEPSTRAMAVLHYVDGLTLEETASTVGLSVSGVRKRLRGLRVRATELEGR